jgi:hypothetical protein
VAPTVLHAMGLPVPTNMDGRVLAEALEPAFVAANPIRHEAPLAENGVQGQGYSDDEQAEISGRLAALGYME